MKATWDKDAELVAEGIDKVYRENTSILQYNNENALSCVVTLAYYNAVNEYTLIREMPSGKGYADIVFLPRRYSTKPAMVVELKYEKKTFATALRTCCAERTCAMPPAACVHRRMYAPVLVPGFSRNVCVWEDMGHKYDKSVVSAIEQIKDRQYPEALKDYYGNLLLVGISYDRESKKHFCIIEGWEKA